jgi:hypothetical protein
MRPSEAYWQVGSVVAEVRQELGQAHRFLEDGDAANALAYLEALTEAYTKHWHYLDDSDGEVGSFFGELGLAWAEALLTADLSPRERQRWERKLDAWQQEIDEYGMEDAFVTAAEAARQGWDDPALQHILRGEGPPSSPETGRQPVTDSKEDAGEDEDEWKDEDEDDWEDENPWQARFAYADDLTRVRLRVLERQERFQEYLYLAEAEGQMGLVVAGLARLGRTEEAVQKGLAVLTTAADALQAARVLREQGAEEEALRIGEHGLTLPEHFIFEKAELADWVYDLAVSRKQPERALRAAVAAFRARPGLDPYTRIQTLAGEDDTSCVGDRVWQACGAGRVGQGRVSQVVSRAAAGADMRA